MPVATALCRTTTLLVGAMFAILFVAAGTGVAAPPTERGQCAEVAAAAQGEPAQQARTTTRPHAQADDAIAPVVNDLVGIPAATTAGNFAFGSTVVQVGLSHLQHGEPLVQVGRAPPG